MLRASDMLSLAFRIIHIFVYPVVEYYFDKFYL